MSPVFCVIFPFFPFSSGQMWGFQMLLPFSLMFPFLCSYFSLIVDIHIIVLHLLNDYAPSYFLTKAI